MHETLAPPGAWPTAAAARSPSSSPPFADRGPQPATSAASRCAALRRELTSPTLSFLMEAHNGLSAKVVEEAGFAGIWASGLSISAALGVRDNNEASWTQ